MNQIINIDTFIKIFQNKKYREKLDKIILNFFGLETTNKLENYKEKNSDKKLEFIVFINRIYILKIIIKDTQNLFNYSKKFYINFSYEENNKTYRLLYPCYWEFYCLKCLKEKRKLKDLEKIGALLATEKRKTAEQILKEIKIFNKNEINDIMKMIEES